MRFKLGVLLNFNLKIVDFTNPINIFGSATVPAPWFGFLDFSSSQNVASKWSLNEEKKSYFDWKNSI